MVPFLNAGDDEGVRTSVRDTDEMHVLLHMLDACILCQANYDKLAME